MSTFPQYAWQPLALLHSNLLANIDALATRRADLAEQLRLFTPAADYFISTSTGVITLAARQDAQLHLLANPVTPQLARQTVEQAFPAGHLTAPMMVVGLDQGWLWKTLYDLPCQSPYPGHRPPLYLICRDLERLWVVLHLQQWQQLLADSRVLLFIGADAIAQLHRHMLDNVIIPWPQRCVDVDPTLWPAGMTLQSLLHDAHRTAGRQMAATRAATSAHYAAIPPADMAARIRSGQPLRIMGVTSLYTTFLQHSMRDWLHAFERMGHQTRLVIEHADHETLNNAVYTRLSHEFKPDLIVIIDHYRREIDGLPHEVPAVMWVQDKLGNIFNPAAGAAQGPRDFCLGFGRQHLSTRFGYPAERFLPATMGINDDRFAIVEPTPAELERFACDVSYVSHASETPEQILAEKAATLDSLTMHFLHAAYERMKAHYATDPRMLSDVLLRRIIADAAADTRVSVGPADLPGIFDFLMQRVNNAMVRHQTLLWLAELGIDLRLYGRGWENHPRLAPFARGVADNATDLPAIYRCSRINLQVTPFGCVHQRMLDGLAAGAFFLARWSQGDAIGQPYRQIWDWCQRHNIRDDRQLRQQADEHILALIRQIDTLQGYDTADYDIPLYDLVRTAADTDFMISAGSIWDDYDTIAFATREQLHEKVRRFLRDAPARREIAGRMRQVVIDRCSYRAINQRLLEMIATQLERQSPAAHAA